MNDNERAGSVESGPPVRKFAGHWGRRRGLIALAVTALVAGALAVGVHAMVVAQPPPGREPDPVLGEVLASVFRPDQCLTPAAAEAAIREQLDSLGYRDWTISSVDAVRTDGCVSAGLDTSSKTVMLIPGQPPGVNEALQDVAQQLMDQCLDKDEATGLLSSVLRDHGVSDFVVRTDGGLAFPAGQEEVVRAHVEAGCFVYSGLGHEADGRPVYLLSGPNS